MFEKILQITVLGLLFCVVVLTSALLWYTGVVLLGKVVLQSILIALALAVIGITHLIWKE